MLKQTNMKHQLKKILLLYFTFTALFFISSCEKDLYDDAIHHHHKHANKISLKQFLNETGIKNFEKSIKVPIANADINARTANISDFNITTDSIYKLVNQENKTTYSFYIEPTSFTAAENEIFNLIYLKSDNVWEHTIIGLEKTSVQSPNQPLYQSSELLYDSRMQNNVTNSRQVCITEVYIFHCTGTGQCRYGQCDMCSLCVDRTLTVDFCGGSGGGSNPTDGSSDNTGGGDGSNNNDPYDFTPNDGSTPFQETPCNQIKNLIKPEKGNLKPDIDWLKTKVTEKKEFGVSLLKRSNANSDGYEYSTERVESTNQYSVDIQVGGYRIGGAHSHPLKSFAIPSYGDLRWLLDCYDRANLQHRKDDAFSMIVCKSADGTINVYCLKINDIEKLRTEIDAIWNDPLYASYTDELEKLDEIHKKERESYNVENPDLEKIFSQKNRNFGIDLYKAIDNTLNQWQKLELEQDPENPAEEKVIPKPC